MNEDRSFADDLLEGADAIAAFLYGDKTKRRKVYHLAAINGLPTFNLGALVCARKSTLLDWVKAQEARGMKP
ncbi:DNA-binding protein [Tardiphaga sp.]|uniref:DNA-binding protein n=1 Tax=Tardiphaga sp. TaxID=1926292 RepID=UPI00260CE4B7|nr:DNA-binding protein [Tardiphaga sp.]